MSANVQEACCAHLHVNYVTHDVGGGAISGEWKCDDCGTAFVPKPYADYVAGLYEDRARLDWLQEQHRGVEAGTTEDERGERTRKLFVVDGAGPDALMHEIRDAIDRAKERYPDAPIDLPIGNEPF